MNDSHPQQWRAVDEYIAGLLIPCDPALDGALAASDAAGLPSINVTPNQGRLLHILARVCGARRILEVGALGGYSTIWLGRALPAGGRLTTLESDPKHVDVARTNIANAGLADVVELRLGPALETLPQLAAEVSEPFDLIFIDADKASTPEYFQWALKISRIGSLIIVDNVVRGGRVVDPECDDPAVRGIRRFNEMLAAEAGVTATEMQTVGSKGYDGFAMALVTSK
jgi:predicted O-methyltransferase YrrM